MGEWWESFFDGRWIDVQLGWAELTTDEEIEDLEDHLRLEPRSNVLDVPYDRDAILAALRRSATDESFRAECAACENPYGAGNAGPRIADVLATVPLDSRLVQKKMTY